MNKDKEAETGVWKKLASCRAEAELIVNPQARAEAELIVNPQARVIFVAAVLKIEKMIKEAETELMENGQTKGGISALMLEIEKDLEKTRYLFGELNDETEVFYEQR